MIVRTLSILGFLAMVTGLLGLILTRSLLSASLPVVALQLAALALMIWARHTFGRRSFHAGAGPTEGGLVTSGPYRWIRHPIYTAVCLFVWPGAIASFSVSSIAFALLATAGAVTRMLCEERLLVASYPEYGEYAAKTKRIIPYVF